MKSPFQFGKVVVGDTFTNRTREIKRLKSNIENNVHTTLISPRRWGKSSLVKQTAIHLAPKSKKIKFCFIDLFKIRDEEDFYTVFANTVIKASSSKTAEWTALAKTFLGGVTPRISFGTDPVNDFEISFNLKGIEKNFEDILQLPEKIAQKKGIDIVVCIDEFQNLANFDDPELFQKRLRAVWQYHQNVTFILYGSKRHMLMHIFENKSMPFYKFGDVIYLDKIEEKHLRTFIIKSFSQTGKCIGETHAEKIIRCVKRHPYYTQQLAHLVWLGTEDAVSGHILDQAVDELLSRNAILYERELEMLTNSQISFLKAVAAGEEKLSSAEVVTKFRLSSSANVSRLKKALEKKEIIDTFHQRTAFIDPVFELWFTRFYNGG